MSVISYSKRKKTVGEKPICAYSPKATNNLSQICLFEQKIVTCESNVWDNPLKIANNMITLFQTNLLADEHVYMIAMNTKCQVLGIMEVAHGGVSGTYCNPREIYQAALLMNASHIVVVHNHPSGVCIPSESDMALKKRIKAAGEIIGIEMIDFIIVGDNAYYSSQEEQKKEN